MNATDRAGDLFDHDMARRWRELQRRARAARKGDRARRQRQLVAFVTGLLKRAAGAA